MVLSSGLLGEPQLLVYSLSSSAVVCGAVSAVHVVCAALSTEEEGQKMVACSVSGQGMVAYSVMWWSGNGSLQCQWSDSVCVRVCVCLCAFACVRVHVCVCVRVRVISMHWNPQACFLCGYHSLPLHAGKWSDSVTFPTHQPLCWLELMLKTPGGIPPMILK